MMDVHFREKFQDAMAVVISDQERAGLDLLTHGDCHCDEDMAGRAWHHYPLQRWAGFEGDYLQPDETRAPWLHYPPGTLLNEIYTAWRWPHVVDKIEHRPLDYPKIWRIAQAKTRKPVRFGTCCSQVMALFLDIHTPKYKDKRQVIWDMAVAMNKELLRAARRRLPADPDRGADAALHGEHLRQGPRGGAVHDRRLQPRGRGSGRRGDLDSHVLGQSQHAARDGRHQLREVDRALPGALPRATSGRWR